MFLIIIVVLTIGQMYFEFKIVRALHMEEFNRKFVLLNLGFSIIISLLFGWLFPAAGMTIAAAGLLSTILSQPMYNFYQFYLDRVRPQYEKGKENYEAHKSTIHQSAADLFKLFCIVIWVLTLPFRILRKIMSTYEQLQERDRNGHHHPTTVH